MARPQRIVSLVPSLTELVWELGAAERLAGRTRFCVEPADMPMFVPEFGGTKNPDVAAIAGVRPDLVIANKEENRREDIEALRAQGIRVLVTDPGTVREAADMILQIGVVIGCEEPARRMHEDVRAAMATIEEGPSLRVFVPIWRRPLMAMGGDCYGSDILAVARARNVFADTPRYPEVSIEDVASRKPDVILLPDEPYHFTEKHIDEFAGVAPTRLVSGQLLWWYGPRMGKAIRELRAIVEEETQR